MNPILPAHGVSMVSFIGLVSGGELPRVLVMIIIITELSLITREKGQHYYNAASLIQFCSLTVF